MKDQKIESLREHTAYLTDYKARTESVERLRGTAERIAADFAAIGVRFGYILNASGLVAVPAIMELLPEPAVDRSAMIWPAVLFTVGILLAAVTNFLAYHSTLKASEAWADEFNARAKEATANYNSPEDGHALMTEVQQHRDDYEKCMGSANSCKIGGIVTFGLSIVFFLIGVFSAICGMIQLQ